MSDFKYKKLCPFKWFILENFPFIEADFDALTNWQLFCKLGKEMNKIIDSENVLGTQVETLTDFVNNYFENLDVQDEINNKLDEMAQDGTLQEIIETYLNTQTATIYSNVEALKNSTNLSENSICKTLGFYQVGDNGKATYKIRQLLNTDVVDEKRIISLTNYPTLIAEFILTDNVLNVRQMGAYNNNTDDDDIDSIQTAINLCNENGIKLVGNKKYSRISKSLVIPPYTQIENLYIKPTQNGAYTNNYLILVNTTNGNDTIVQYPKPIGHLKNMFISSQLENGNYNTSLNGIYNKANNLFENIETSHLDITFRNSGDYLDFVRIENIQVGYKTTSNNYAIILSNLGDACSIKKAHYFENNNDGKFISITTGKNPILLENIINGIINIENSTVNIKDFHNELPLSEKIKINNSNVNIDTLYFWAKGNDISITASDVTITNYTTVYIMDDDTTSITNDNDINITDNISKLILQNCYKLGIKRGNISLRYRSFIKTNLDTEITDKAQRIIDSSNFTFNNSLASKVISNYSAGNVNSTNQGKWNKETGTYYYALQRLIDEKRMLRYSNVLTYNIELANGGNMAIWYGVSRGKWRVYRGTASNQYSEYVDISLDKNFLWDNGNLCCGYNWKERTPSNVDTALSIPVDGKIEYNGKNIKVYTNSVNDTTKPTNGNWEIGDIIIDTRTMKHYIATNSGEASSIIWKTLTLA